MAKQVMLALFALCLSGAALAQGKWIKLAPFPEPAEELLGAAANGKLYVFCGLAPGWKPMGLVYEYDPATDKWTKKKPMPLASHHVSFTEHKGKIYAFGGFVLPQAGPPAWVPIDNAWEYDPASDNWRALAPLPTKRGSPVAASVAEKIYVIAGANVLPGSPAVHPARPHYSVSAVEEYDPAANTWRARAPIPTPRNHAVAGVVNGKIYVIGGRVRFQRQQQRRRGRGIRSRRRCLGCAESAHAERAQRHGRRRLSGQDLRDGRRGPGLPQHVHLARLRVLRSGDQQLEHARVAAGVAARPGRGERRRSPAHGERRRAVRRHRRACPYRLARRIRVY